MKLGLVINPMAGIGGAVGLKGSDGEQIVQQALERGAKPAAAQRVLAAMQSLRSTSELSFLSCSGAMGSDVLQKLNISHDCVYLTKTASTSAEDTRRAVLAMCDAGIDLLMFAGGDGTARDVLDALTQCGQHENLPVVGIPAGCKIHSAVYAVSPGQAGELVANIIKGEPMAAVMAEVMDLDEQAFRQGQVKARCYGYMLVPQDDSRMQVVKQGGVNHEALAVQDIAADVVENMEPDCYYFIGAGSTTKAVMDELGLPATLLGVDVVFNESLLASDVDETGLLAYLDDKPAKIVVSAIGGQGHIFGRGNQQFSDSVIEKTGINNIIIIATHEKLRTLEGRPLLVDTGNTELDKGLRGVKQIVTGYEQRTLYSVS